MPPARSRPVPGRTSDDAQIALLEATATGAEQADIVVLGKIQRRLRVRWLRIEALVIRAHTIFERHVAPILDRLSAFDAQAGFQDQPGKALASELIGYHRADDT